MTDILNTSVEIVPTSQSIPGFEYLRSDCLTQGPGSKPEYGKSIAAVNSNLSPIANSENLILPRWYFSFMFVSSLRV